MKGEFAVAGFVLTADEWEALDVASRAQLMAVAMRRDEPWVVETLTGVLSEPTDLATRR
jgi:hypothetical protein